MSSPLRARCNVCGATFDGYDYVELRRTVDEHMDMHRAEQAAEQEDRQP